VGFAAGQGAYLVSAPTVHRRDRSRAAGSDPAWPSGLDLAAGGKETAREILNAAARGIPVGPAGAIVLWFPELRADGGAALAVDYAFLVNNLASALESTLKEGEHPSSFLVCLPAGLDADARKSLDADLKTHVPRCSAVLTHRHAVPLAWHQAEGAPPVPVPALLYLDPGGVVRVVDRFEPGRTSLSYLMNQWLRVFEALAAKSAAGGRTTP
jgi:hypothetical protein